MSVSNLGKLFTHVSARPATEEDIQNLVKDDWIKAKGEGFCYQFRRWDEDICIGVWEGKEFYVPKHDLMVCSAVDNEITKFTNQNKNIIMKTFQFSQTQEIAIQIAQMQEQLNKLTASLQPYQEYEQKAEELRLQVAQYGNDMTAAGIFQGDILKWAKALYEAASSEELNMADSGAIAAQNEEIIRLKTENAKIKNQFEKAIDHNAETLKMQRDKTLKKVKEMETLTQEVENLKAQNRKLQAQIEQSQQKEKQVEEAIEQKEMTESEAKIAGREFIASVKTKTGLNNLTWQNIKKACCGSQLALREMAISATLKYQKELIEKLPNIIADYMFETGDVSDMQWIGSILKAKVEEILKEKKSFPFQPKDLVKELESGEVWQVHNFDGEWLSIKQGNKISSLHKSEVELIHQEIAA